MRRTSLAITCVLALLATLLIFRSQPATAQGRLSQGSGLQQFAGTVWFVFQSPGLPPLPGIATLHADGTFLVVDGTDEGLGGLTTPNSAQLGVYKRTGPLQTTLRGVFLNYDATGSPVSAVVTDSVANWNPDLSGGAGVLQQRAYDLLLGEDPTDPTQGTPVGDPIPFQLKRFGV